MCNNNIIINDELVDFCRLYNLPIRYLGKILKDPKVIPMIRGKAFEFSVCERLEEILDLECWQVDKPFLNPQQGHHDQDVLITHLESGRQFSIECKLAAKGGFKFSKNQYCIKVKCMRSRTLGAAQVAQRAPLLGVSPDSLSVHNDQYRPQDFDLLITSLANAFYQTDENGIFIWAPCENGRRFLAAKYGQGLSDDEYQSRAFADMYAIRSDNIAVLPNTGIRCSRRECNSPNSCGFIPNYPQIIWNADMEVNGGWLPVDRIAELLEL